MKYSPLLPAIRDILTKTRQRAPLDEVFHALLEKACALANAPLGSFLRIDHRTESLIITHTFGSDWTEEAKRCRLKFGQGLTGQVALTGLPFLSEDTLKTPNYYPLFSHVRSELVVPVFMRNEIWGLITIDSLDPHAFTLATLDLLTVFAEISSFALTLHCDALEQQKMLQQLIQSEKLASLGEAIAGIAHEINNPLTTILMNADLLGRQNHPPAIHERVKAIASEADRTSSLVKNMLQFSRRDTGEKHATNLNELIRKSIQLCRTPRSRVRYEFDTLGTDLDLILNPQQIQQVLVNLLTNAEQSIPKDRTDGLVRIALDCEADRILIGISDNGTGIPPPIQSSIFDPFFTTKAPGEGTGLGLSIAHKIIAAHDGTLQLASSNSTGTTFLIELPLRSRAELLAPHPIPLPLEGHILLVDDERHVADTIEILLQQLHLKVTRAHNARTALEILRRENIDLILSDVRMPDLDGLQFYEAARRQTPRYQENFVFMSGYALRDLLRTRHPNDRLCALQKPFDIDQLHKVLSRYLPAATHAA